MSGTQFLRSAGIRATFAGMLTFMRRRRVGNHYELEFVYRDQTLVAHLGEKGPPSFQNQLIPELAKSQLDEWAEEAANQIYLSGLQSALK